MNKQKRYEQIKHLREQLDLDVRSVYGKKVFGGALPNGVELSDDDLLLLCDHGTHAPFGGTVYRHDGRFIAEVYID